MPEPTSRSPPDIPRTPKGPTRETRIRAAGLIAGPLAALAVYLMMGSLPGLGHDARTMGAVVVLMGVWWVSEAIPLAATALVPIVCFPALGIGSITATGARYGHPLIFLFMGGLMLGKGLERWGAHKRLALWIILLVGTSPRRIVAGVMLAAAVLSAMVSNTATAMMMLPIVASVGLLAGKAAGVEGNGDGDTPPPVPHAFPQDSPAEARFHACLLLALAYGCSIGGIATITGTPPNGFMVAFLDQDLGVHMSYARWLALGIPLTALLLPLSWAYLVFVASRVRAGTPAGGREPIREQLRRLGPVSTPEALSVGVFALTALAWVSHAWIESRLGLRGIDDATIAIAGAMLMLALPAGDGRSSRLLNWEHASAIPWGILILFGGGLAMAQGITNTGLDVWIGQRIAALGDPGELTMLAGASTLMVFLTEVTSNTATTGTMLPVLAAAAQGIGVSADKLVIVAAVSASCAFMLPVATPPNAIVFSTGRIGIRRMAMAGLGLNLIAIVVITAMVWLLGTPLLGLGAGAETPAPPTPTARLPDP